MERTEYEGIPLDDKARRDIAYLDQFIEKAKREAQLAIIESRAKELEDLALAVSNSDPFEVLPFLVNYIERRRGEIKAMIERFHAEGSRTNG